jgi:hypothetical protein
MTTSEPQKLTLTNKHTSSINISSLRRRMTEQPKNKKKEAVCVTGVNDFIGSWLVGTLLDFGYSTIHAHGSNPFGVGKFCDCGWENFDLGGFAIWGNSEIDEEGVIWVTVRLMVVMEESRQRMGGGERCCTSG